MKNGYFIGNMIQTILIPNMIIIPIIIGYKKKLTPNMIKLSLLYDDIFRQTQLLRSKYGPNGGASVIRHIASQGAQERPFLSVVWSSESTTNIQDRPVTATPNIPKKSMVNTIYITYPLQVDNGYIMVYPHKKWFILP